jgi:hypothetical protein
MTHTASSLDYNMRFEGDALYVVFDETTDVNDWAADFDFFPKAFDIYPGSRIKAHEGIARQYMDIRETLMDYLYGSSVKHIFVAGFSLGGAITTAAVQDIGYHIDRDGLNKTVYGINYDGPRFFGPSAIVKNAVADRLITVKTHCDPVVHLPFKIMPTVFSFHWKPFKLRLTWPRITFWKNYGQIKWIGRPWRLWPVQHLPAQIEKALEETYGR